MVRFVVRVLIASVTAVVFLLIQPVFWSPALSPAVGIVLIGLALMTYFRPHNGLLVVAAFAPLGRVWSPLLGPYVRGSEVLVLGFLAGALLRGWTLHRFRSIPLDRLHVAVSLFGLLVATSCWGQLRLSVGQLRDLFDYAIYHYLTSLHAFGTIFSAMLLLEGLLLLLYAAHCCRTQAGFGWRLARMLVIGASAAATFNLWFFAHELIETGAPAARFADFFLRQRWSAHVGDVNAAGSFFAMTIFMALGLALSDRNRRVAWSGVGAIIGLALWMTASRTALTAVFFVGVVRAVARSMTRSRDWRYITALAIAATAILGMYAQDSLPRRSSAQSSEAVNIRWMYLETTRQMLKAHPLFGVGIGQYAAQSAHFSSPELLAIYPRENAHNNFAQVAGELGLVGFSAFLAILTLCLWPPDGSRRHEPVVTLVLVGLAAFIVTWLGAHPLLVPEVAYPFWLALAIVPGTHSRHTGVTTLP